MRRARTRMPGQAKPAATCSTLPSVSRPYLIKLDPAATTPRAVRRGRARIGAYPRPSRRRVQSLGGPASPRIDSFTHRSAQGVGLGEAASAARKRIGPCGGSDAAALCRAVAPAGPTHPARPVVMPCCGSALCRAWAVGTRHEPHTGGTGARGSTSVATRPTPSVPETQRPSATRDLALGAPQTSTRTAATQGPASAARRGSSLTTQVTPWQWTPLGIATTRTWGHVTVPTLAPALALALGQGARRRGGHATRRLVLKDLARSHCRRRPWALACSQSRPTHRRSVTSEALQRGRRPRASHARRRRCSTVLCP